MCYDDKARPPAPPGPVGSAHGEDVVLTAADGTRFAAYAAFPEGPSKAAILIYPDVREAVALLGLAFEFDERVGICENHRPQLRFGDGVVIVGNVRRGPRHPKPQNSSSIAWREDDARRFRLYLA